MQTLYYSTSNFIRHKDNIIDLAAYRQRMQTAAEQDDQELTPETEIDVGVGRTKRRQRPSGLLLDACASMAVVVMALTFTLKLLA